VLIELDPASNIYHVVGIGSALPQCRQHFTVFAKSASSRNARIADGIWRFARTGAGATTTDSIHVFSQNRLEAKDCMQATPPHCPCMVGPNNDSQAYGHHYPLGSRTRSRTHRCVVFVPRIDCNSIGRLLSETLAFDELKCTLPISYWPE
jgi:hypothetical protein